MVSGTRCAGRSAPAEHETHDAPRRSTAKSEPTIPGHAIQCADLGPSRLRQPNCYYFRPARGGFREISVKAKDFEKLLAKDAPPAARIRGGFPKYNFIGGHNDPETVPVAALIASSERALERSGRALATYNLDSGPQDNRELRNFVANAGPSDV